MGGHHLILGRLTDYISGDTLDDTLDERHRQLIARLLAKEKGFSKARITPRRQVEARAGGKFARLAISYTLEVDGRTAMIVQYGPGSLVTRHRPALAMGRLVADYQVPVVVVTNGEQADILNGETGGLLASGLEKIPHIDQLRDLMRQHTWPSITAQRVEMESRVLIAYELDGRCPCDDTAASTQTTSKDDCRQRAD